MNFIIESPRIKRLNQKTQQAVLEKFERFEKLFDRIERSHIVLKKERSGSQENYFVEARLVVPGNDLFAKGHAMSFEVAAENVCLDLESQIKRYKAKLNQKATSPVDTYINDEEFE